MTKWIPHRHDGDQTPIEARRFAHWIGTVQHWFALHQNIEGGHGWTVSHWDSGYRVLHIPNTTLMVCLGREKDAARLALNNLVALHGESLVHRKLADAPARKKVLSAAVANATI